MKDLRCIDPGVGKLIGYYESGHLKGGDRERFEIHLVTCTYCFNEIFQTQPVIESLRMKAPTVVTQLSRERARPKAPLPERLFSLRDPRPWAGLVLLFMVAMVMVWVYLARQRRDHAEGELSTAGTPSRIQDLDPNGALAEAPRELRWRALARAARYEVALFDRAGKPIWKRETITNHVSLPEEVRAGLRARDRYAWRVQVLSPATVASISGTAEFTVRVDSPATAPLKP